MEETQPLPQPELSLCDSLMIWLQTFNTASPCQDVKQLTNGVAMAQVLHQIDAAWFNESWLSRIKEDVGDNWRIKANNLKKILQGIMSYYHEFLGQQISEALIPDLNQITECSDSVELGRLLQLILGCAVNCERKQVCFSQSTFNIFYVIVYFSTRLIEQRDTLKETNEELRCSQVQQDHLNQTVHMTYLTNRLSKERIRELQQQIEDLQKSLQEQGSKSEGESSECKVAKFREYEEKLIVSAWYNKVIKTLDPKLNPASAEIMLLRKQLAEKERRIEILEFFTCTSTNVVGISGRRKYSLNPMQKINELEAALQKKDEDMKAMEERYKMYLEKARNSECKVAKFREYEEKLIVSAWYNKSLAFQKLGMESRLVSGGGACKDTGACTPARSFLAQQRHITNTRRNLSVRVPATTAD
ncbi:PREDICTED: protein Hook homolog 1 [Propithecus coquereli]|uniref:protein Hook homolog 1 n=1 Tax=Propithecus coquereli TaxID=379532 RepID=UPI00063F0CB6|nr:PREDICTED: protein Hook homolog 1 [Propithecus coquereli]